MKFLYACIKRAIKPNPNYETDLIGFSLKFKDKDIGQSFEHTHQEEMGY